MNVDNYMMWFCVCCSDGTQGHFSGGEVVQMDDMRRNIALLTARESRECGVAYNADRLLVRLSFHHSFDYAVRILRKADEKCVVFDMLNERRENLIKNKRARILLKDILGIASLFHSSIVITVSHSAMASVMAEKVYKTMTGKIITLPDVLPGNGYCIVQRTAKVIDISQSFCEVPCD